MNQKGAPLNLAERALKAKFDTQKALNLPGAYMIPASVRELIREQSEILAALALEVRGVQREILGDEIE